MRRVSTPTGVLVLVPLQVSSTADGLAEEKAQLQAEVERSRIELQGQQQAHRQLTAENANLLERVAAFDERRVSCTDSSRMTSLEKKVSLVPHWVKSGLVYLPPPNSPLVV